MRIKVFTEMIRNYSQGSIIFLLLTLVVIWRFNPFMPQVFFGDDLNYLLAFKDGQCGTFASQILTTTCYDKFRPVASGFVLLLMNLFDSSVTGYMIVNVLLQALSAYIAYKIAFQLSNRNKFIAIGVSLTVASSRFAAYQVTQVIGPVEGLGTPLFLGILYMLIYADILKINVLRCGWFAVVLLLLLIHNHERYIVISGWLGLAFLVLPTFRELPRHKLLSLLGGCIFVPVFYVTYKTAVLDSPFLVGTGGVPLSLNINMILAHVKQAVLSLWGFNEGPEYLTGVRLDTLPWFPAWIMAITFATSLILPVLAGIKQGFTFQNGLVTFKNNSYLWPILLVVLAALLLVPAISTIRLEQRWLLSPYILMLFLGAWGCGQLYKLNKYNFPVWYLGVIFPVAAISLDSMIVKYFHNVFFVDSARYAEMVKRDIADIYPGESSDIYLLSSYPAHCEWSLMNGEFFRIYGGVKRAIRCVSREEVPIDALDTAGARVFSEVTSGKISDITEEFREFNNLNNKEHVTYDFIKNFDRGIISRKDKVDTPSGTGALIMPVTTIFGGETALTIISGFSYRFEDVLVENNSVLRFGVSMIYPAEPVEAIISLTEKNMTESKVIFAQKIDVTFEGNILKLSPESIPLYEYSGRKVTLEFSARPTGTNMNGQWLGFSHPRIVIQGSR